MAVVEDWRNTSTGCQSSSQMFHMMSTSAWCHLVSSSTRGLRRTIISTSAPASRPKPRRASPTTTITHRIRVAAIALQPTVRKPRLHPSASPCRRPRTLTSPPTPRSVPPSQQMSTLMMTPVAFSHMITPPSTTPIWKDSFPPTTHHLPQSRICPHYLPSLEPAWPTQRLTAKT